MNAALAADKRMTPLAVRPTCRSMSHPPDDPRPLPRPKITPEERRAREADRLATIRLRLAITRALEERGIPITAAIAEVLGVSPAEANKLMTGKLWRAGDVDLLHAVAARLGLTTPS